MFLITFIVNWQKVEFKAEIFRSNFFLVKDMLLFNDKTEIKLHINIDIKVWYVYTMEYYSAIKRRTFESVLMR